MGKKNIGFSVTSKYTHQSICCSYFADRMAMYVLSGRVVSNNSMVEIYRSTLSGNNLDDFQPESIPLIAMPVVHTINVSRPSSTNSLEMVHFCEIKVYGGRYCLGTPFISLDCKLKKLMFLL